MKYKFTDDPNESIVITDDLELEFLTSMVQFTKVVRIKNCHIKTLDIYANFFADGLILENCIVENQVFWIAGGHNLKPIIFNNCIFKEFVDFEDCCFDGDIILSRVKFLKGTNFFGNKGTPVEVSFKNKPKLKDIEGDLSINTYKKKTSPNNKP